MTYVTYFHHATNNYCKQFQWYKTTDTCTTRMTLLDINQVYPLDYTDYILIDDV